MAGTAFHQEIARLIDRGEAVAARDRLETALSGGERDPWSHLYLAIVLQGTDVERAAALAVAALHLEPDDLGLRAGAVGVLLRAGRIPEAKAALRVAEHQIDDGTTAGLTALLISQTAAVLVLERKHEQALGVYAVARAMRPEQVEWAEATAAVLVTLRRSAEAAAVLEDCAGHLADAAVAERLRAKARTLRPD